MKKALSYMMIGALTSATVFMMMNKGKNFDDLKNEKNKLVEKFKAMF
jgi:uncharacterized membrane protein YgaE (UPF0421/DUF939 family)